LFTKCTVFELPNEIRHLQCFIFGVEGNLKADYRQTESRTNVPFAPAWLELSEGREN
jgi:hypothetical protein